MPYIEQLQHLKVIRVLFFTSIKHNSFSNIDSKNIIKTENSQKINII